VINFLLVFLILECIYWFAKKDYRPDFIKNSIKRSISIQQAIAIGMRGGKWPPAYNKEEYDARHDWGLQTSMLIWGSLFYILFIIAASVGYLILSTRTGNFPFILNLNLLPYSLVGFISYLVALFSIHDYFRMKEIGLLKDRILSILIFFASIITLLFCISKLL